MAHKTSLSKTRIKGLSKSETKKLLDKINKLDLEAIKLKKKLLKE